MPPSETYRRRVNALAVVASAAALRFWLIGLISHVLLSLGIPLLALRAVVECRALKSKN